jgi:Beta-propeller repeat
MISVLSRSVLTVTVLVLAQAGAPIPIQQHLALESPNDIVQPDLAAQDRIAESYGKLPLSFEANQGQTDAQVKFLSRGSGYTLFLTGDEAVFSFRRNKAKHDTSIISRQPQPSQALPAANAVLRMKLVKPNVAAEPTGEDQLLGKTSYLVGNDSKMWHSNVPTYAKVKYEGVYPGIDLVYYGNQRQLEYDFIVAPGADPRRIQFDVRGANKITRDDHGDLVLQTGVGEVRWHAPVAYQEKDGVRQEIAAGYVIKDKNRVEFEVANYDSRKALFIDPLIYSTYLGGSGGGDYGLGIAVDNSGNAYVTGATASDGFPTVNPLQPAGGGGTDAFVAKFNPSGSALIYSTYLGGNHDDFGNGIATDNSGNAYVVGMTNSPDFPTMSPLQPANGGGYDAFVAKLNPTGSALVYSTYLGGRQDDYGFGIAADSSGNAYVTGETGSYNFPTANPLQPANGGVNDAFIAKLNPTGSALIYSTYLGGHGNETGYGIAVHSGNAYVTGYTTSTNFPTVNPLQPANAGVNDAFVTEINPTGSALIYSTYLGGRRYDQGNGIAVDSSGNAYVVGTTQSTNFPTVNPLQRVLRGGLDAFVTKLNPTGSALIYSTYLGGSLDDHGFGIAVDTSGSAYVTGITLSTNFRTVKPLQPTNGGLDDAFVAKVNPSGSALAYSTYLGGSGVDYGLAIAQHSGNAYVTGYTASTNFPTMNPLQPANAGQANAFVSEISRPAP